jgi:hypothetical protein
MKKEDAYQVMVVDGEELRWRLRHTALHDKEIGMKGISVSVWRRPEKTRELILDFPYELFREDKSPNRNALVAVIRPAIEQAMAAGWDPDSRGRTFRFQVPGEEEV